MLSLAGTCKGAVPPQRGRNGVRPMLWALGFGGLMLLWMVASSLLLAGAVAAGIALLGHWQRGPPQRADYAAVELPAARHGPRGGRRRTLTPMFARPVQYSRPGAPSC